MAVSGNKFTPKVNFDEARKREAYVTDENGDEVDVEALTALFEDNPDSLTVEELSYLPPELLAPPPDPEEFYTNLADFIDDNDLSMLGNDICQWVNDDRASRSDWEDRITRGIKFLGTTEKTTGGATGKGFSRAVHPGIHEARVQFQARAIAEVWPAQGPVKTHIMGADSEEVNAQSKRVGEYMNYLYTQSIHQAYNEEEKMEYWLPITGSCFKKAFWDPLQKKVAVRFVHPEKLLVPADAADLATAPRYTELFDETANDTLRKMEMGVYRKINLLEPDASTVERSKLEEEIDDAEGVTHVGYSGDQTYRRFETYVNLILPGFEDVNAYGQETGIAQPYIVVVDEHTQKVLSIYRGWREDDPLQTRRVYHVHFKFLPGSKFYGEGLIHSIGGLSESATGALRALLDSAMLNNLQGGFKSQELDVRGGDLVFEMGVWKTVRANSDELKAGLVTLPTHEPSSTLFQLLGFLTDQMQRFASTTEIMMGDAANSAPVGTTLAQIEQGSKVFSGIHKRLHNAHAEEYQLVAQLVSENMEEGEKYPYAMREGVEGSVMAEDFDSRIDVIPVSDPNIVSQSQRITKSQSTLQLASQYPDLHDMKVVIRDLHQALGATNIDEIMPPPQEAPVLDPVSESMALLQSQPVQASPDQDHPSHVAFLEQWWGTVPPEYQQNIEAAYMALLYQHMALGLKQQIESQTGQAVDQIPPEMLSQIQVQPIAQGQNSNEMEREGFDRDQGRQDQESSHKMGLATMKTESDMARKDADTMNKLDLTMMAAGGEEERKNLMASSKIMSDAQAGVNQAKKESSSVQNNLEK